MGELHVEAFDLALTMESGQFFRYRREGDARDNASYVLLTQRKTLRVSQRATMLSYKGADEGFIRTLFQLNEGYGAQVQRLLKDPAVAPLLRRYEGLHVMRQDLHEAILGFICSSASNIPKIRMNLQLLAQHCGEVVEEHHHLPRNGVTLNTDLVIAAKTGYRAKFLVETNKLLTDELLDELMKRSYEDAHELLCTLPGVGPKIADCVCLFALGHGEAFPVDVHILRAMKALFPRRRFKSESQVRAFAQQRWGADAGLAQQFIYQWARDDLRRSVGK